ncbi:MAG: glycosyl hydrolase family 28-related protein, partial [bacterium]|nr:glycosyl hydrolase family 28-related protein [bacterium]
MRKISIKRVLSVLLTVAILSVSVIECVLPMTAFAATLPSELVSTVTKMEDFLKTGPFIAEDLNDAQIIYNEYITVDETVRNSATDARIDAFIDVYNQLKSGAKFVDNFEGELAWQVEAKITRLVYTNAAGQRTTAQDTRQRENTTDITANGFWGIVEDDILPPSPDLKNHALSMRKNFTNTKAELNVNHTKDHYLINSVTSDYLGSNAEIFNISADWYYNSDSTTESLFVTNYTSDHNWTGIFIDGSTVKKVVSTHQDTTPIKFIQNVSNVTSLVDVLGNPVSFKSGQWLSTEMTYDIYDKVYLFKISGLNASSATVTAEFALASSDMISKVAFASRTIAGSPMVDNVVFYEYGPACYPMIIDAIPDLDVLTIDDAKKLEYIRKFVDGLSGIERYQISNLQKLVDAEAKLEELLKAAASSGTDVTNLDFENPTHIDPLYSVNLNNKNNLYVSSNTVKGNGNDSNDILVFRSDNGSAKFMLSPYIQADNELYEVTFKAYLKNSESLDVIYDYVDDQNYSLLRISAAGTGIVTRPRTCVDGKESSGGTVQYSPIYYEEEANTILDTPINKWYTFNLTYLDEGVHFAIKNMYDNVGVFVGFATTGLPTVSKSFGKLSLKNPLSTNFAIRAGDINRDYYFDDFSFKYKDTPEHRRVSELMDKYPDIIYLDENTVSKLDEPAIKDVADTYNSYDEKTKRYLPFMPAFLKPLQDALETQECADQTFDPVDPATVEQRIDPESGQLAYVFKDDFENGIRRWANVGDTYRTESAWISMPTAEDPDNMALAVKGITPALGVKDEYMALNGYKLVSRKFTMTMNTDNWNYYAFVSAYADSGNFTYMAFREFAADDGYPYRGNVVNDYNASQVHYFYYNTLPKGVILTLDVEQTFNYETNSVVTIITDAEGNRVKSTLPLPTGKPYALNVLNGCVVSNSEYYIYDNYEALYVERDPDYERKKGETHVFYTSNTFLNPGDVALINGYYVGDNIDKVEICPVPNTVDLTNLEYGYADRESYSSAGVLDSDDISILPTAEYWNDSEAVEADILQTTERSVKFIIPPTFAKGMYSVKITYDDVTTTHPIATTNTLYLNAPFVEYTIGDDGETTTAGGNLVVVGENLFPDYDRSLTDEQNLARAKTELAVCIKDKSGNVVAERIDITKVRSVYSFNVTIPETVTVGEYELWVYSGYGNSSCWSIPFDFKVDVDLRSTFASKVYNVVDYGSTCKGAQNFTPILSSVCNIAHENGGGTVYLPSGIYRLMTPVIIPENVILKGQEKETTQIIFNPTYWQVGDLPSSLLYFTKNSGMQDISVIGSRRKTTLNFVGSDAQNLYFEDVRFEFDYTGGQININGSPINQNTGYLTSLVRAEAGGRFLVADQAINVRFEDVRYASYNDSYGGIMLDRASQQSKYWYFNNTTLHEINWSEGCMNSSMFENTDFLYCVTGLWGDGFYYGDCQFTSNTTNNRELFVADMVPAYTGTMKFAYETDPVSGEQVPMKDASGLNTIFKVQKVSEREFLNGQLYVRYGPGDGQTRKVVELLPGDRIRIDRPLAVDPETTTLTVTIRRPRQNIYFVDNYWYNGQCGGFFSGACDVVYDGNLRERNWTVYLWPQTDDPIWYLTVLNDEFLYDPFYYHNADGSSFKDSPVSPGWDMSYSAGGARCYAYRDSIVDGQYTDVGGDGD